MNKRETNLNEIKRLIDIKIETEEDDFYLDREDNYFHLNEEDGYFYPAERVPKLIQSVDVFEDLRECIEFGALDLFIYEEEDIEEKETIWEALGLEDEDLDEIYLYYVQKLCEHHNLDYKLSKNREDYIVFAKSDSKK